MSKQIKTSYTPELKAEAVKMVTDQKLGVTEVAKRLAIPMQTLHNWVRKAQQGRLDGLTSFNPTIGQLEAEVKRLKKQLAMAEMEREILKKATAFFARGSL